MGNRPEVRIPNAAYSSHDLSVPSLDNLSKLGVVVSLEFDKSSKEIEQFGKKMVKICRISGCTYLPSFSHLSFFFSNIYGSIVPNSILQRCRSGLRWNGSEPNPKKTGSRSEKKHICIRIHKSTWHKIIRIWLSGKAFVFLFLKNSIRIRPKNLELDPTKILDPDLIPRI